MVAASPENNGGTPRLLERTSTIVKNLSKQIRSSIIATGFEEGRAHSFGIGLASMVPGASAEKLSEAYFFGSGYSQATAFSSISHYGKSIISRISSLLGESIDAGPGGSTQEEFLSTRVDDAARHGSAAFNASLTSMVDNTPLQKSVGEMIKEDVSELEALGYPRVVEINEGFLLPENAPKLRQIGIKNARRTVSITRNGVDVLSRETVASRRNCTRCCKSIFFGNSRY